MKLSDYIIEFLSTAGVTDIFGYPGGCINHLIDSAYKSDALNAHLAYHEQGAAFEACGYAQKSNRLGVAYSTSGPGATNLITGIASAYFDSIPTLFITGQVDSPAEKGDLRIRQRGFQETNIVACVKEITKWAYHVSSPDEIKYCLEKALHTAFSGNPGPVLLDIPNDFQRADVDVERLDGFTVPKEETHDIEGSINTILNALLESERPLILAGNGAKQNKLGDALAEFAEIVGTPVLTSLAAFDLLPFNHPLNYGFIGTNGHRYANLITDKADLVISFGNRMSIRPLGIKRESFAPNARIIRIDIDKDQLNYAVRNDQECIIGDLKELLPTLIQKASKLDHQKWINTCAVIKSELSKSDAAYPNEIIAQLSDNTPSSYDISSDIGQNLIWLAQSYRVKKGQTVSMSAGNGPMGYSIPAGIGSYYASGRPVVSLCGDGGFMMNVQELQFIIREKIPNKIVCLNNSALGMIRAWQSRYLDTCSQTTGDTGYMSPNIRRLAEAFGLKYSLIANRDELANFNYVDGIPEVIEILIPTNIDTYPNGNMHDQNPQLDRKLLEEISKL